ncbi:alpha/beta hydrolase [uncultured Croceitalea sp.]|uniref:alpha/beta hydrolase family protein n=1 Tax=uncultured Croceitalea sp. TaxID=1798908 RepID=UPI0033056294
MKEIQILSNSEILSATLFEGIKNDSVLIIASATGVKQEYYQKFAQFTARHGISVVTFDYNGIGRSLKKPIRKLKNNAADWGKNDLESIIQYVIKHYPKSKKVILGHSIGGQLIGLSKSSVELDKIVLVAAQSGYWKFWKGLGRIKMWLNWYILFPLLLNMFGYLKSKKISGMENLPKNVANQWRNWGKNYNYILGDTSIKNTYYNKIKADVTAFNIEDDNFAPMDAVQWMTTQYKIATKKSIYLKPNDFEVEKIGHFGVFNERFNNSIWTQILNEIKY